MEVKEIGWEDVDWNYVYQEKKQWRDFVHNEMNLRVPLLTGYATSRISKWILFNGFTRS
jgi:hypothetical protein